MKLILIISVVLITFISTCQSASLDKVTVKTNNVPELCFIYFGATARIATTYEPLIKVGDSLGISIAFDPKTGKGFITVRDRVGGSYVFDIVSLGVQNNFQGRDMIDIRFNNARGNLGGIVRNGNGDGTIILSGADTTFNSGVLPTDPAIWRKLDKGTNLAIPNNDPLYTDQALTIGPIDFTQFGHSCKNEASVDFINVIDEGVETNLGCRKETTQKLQSMIDSLSPGGTLYFPPGIYRLDGELIIKKRLNILGEGVRSQLLQCADTNLFRTVPTTTISAMSVKNINLGSRATTEGTSLLNLTRVNRSHFENITMQGGYYGIYLHGSLGNYLENIHSDTNIGSFHDRGLTSTNQYWIFLNADEINGFSPNANTIINPQLAGGTNGIHLKASLGGAGLVIIGGAIEGMARSGLRITNNSFPVIVSGVHFEGNCKSQNCLADIELFGSRFVRLESVLVQPGLDCKCVKDIDGNDKPTNCKSYASNGLIKTQTYLHIDGSNHKNENLVVVDSVVGKLDIQGNKILSRNIKETRINPLNCVVP